MLMVISELLSAGSPGVSRFITDRIKTQGSVVGQADIYVCPYTPDASLHN